MIATGLKQAVWPLAVLLLATGCLTTPGAVNEPEDALARLQVPSGWERGPIATYTQETLFELINGEMEIYIPYGYRKTAVSTIQDELGTEVEVSLYEMGSPLDAFGIYSNYRYSAAEFIEVGAQGMVDDYQLFFFKGVYFVRMSAFGDAEANRNAMMLCAHRLADVLPGKDALPRDATLAHGPGVDKNSIKYSADSPLGYAFFPRGLTGQARVGDEQGRVFVVFYETPDAAAAGWSDYEQYLRESGAVFTPYGRAFATTDPLYGQAVVTLEGRYLVGVAGMEAQTAQGLLGSITAQLD